MPRARISACLIVQNEHERLPAALASVAFCDEVIVVDGGSTDGTVELARAAGAQVMENPWRGFAIQRNVAIDASHGDWILEVDADERVSSELRTSIEALLEHPPESVDIAVCALRNRFLGGLLGSSAKYPAYRSRLFRRGAYRHDESLTVHEGLELRELPAILDGDLEHELAGSIREALSDTWSYARLESRLIVRPRSGAVYLKGIVLRPAAKLCYRTIVDGGWRDGWRGLLKISLDVGSDALVWIFVLLRGDGAREPSGGGGDHGAHFGPRRAGPARVLAIADRGRPTQSAIRWLSALQQRGVDVALIAEEPPPTSSHTDHADPSDAALAGIPCRAVHRIGALTVIRALEVERQVRVVDAVVLFGGRARLMRHFLPPTLRPELPGLDLHTAPERAFELIENAISR
jgi:glycosyltransferase involved in cell wall biosynthesis